MQFVDSGFATGLFVVTGAGQEGTHQSLGDLRGILVAGPLRETGPRFGDVPVAKLEVALRFASNGVEHRSLAVFAQAREKLLGPAEGAGVVRAAKAPVRRDHQHASP